MKACVLCGVPTGTPIVSPFIILLQADAAHGGGIPHSTQAEEQDENGNKNHCRHHGGAGSTGICSMRWIRRIGGEMTIEQAKKLIEKSRNCRKRAERMIPSPVPGVDMTECTLLLTTMR